MFSAEDSNLLQLASYETLQSIQSKRKLETCNLGILPDFGMTTLSVSQMKAQEFL